jgi:hypothetical protein
MILQSFPEDIKHSFDRYAREVHSASADIRFWSYFLDQSISSFLQEPNLPEKVFSSVFHAYNINPHDPKDGYLDVFEQRVYFQKYDMEGHRLDFFSWIQNLSLIKIYSALELFLIEAIQIRYYPEIALPIGSKKAAEVVKQKIREFHNSKGISFDTKNNRHIIRFGQESEEDIKVFLSAPIRVNFKTNWGNFFELISILRNIVAHKGGIVERDTQNAIGQTAKDVFKSYFQLEKVHGDDHLLKAKEGQFLNLINLCNDFVTNMIKLMFRQEDFTFLRK